ncbi:hypothetical protein FHX08_003643 [Rhizobium sp. BK529]|uniref:hypothetical protein n=1 Tax=unclassified Rhizobium TaxID=2613769 RepID=UPI001046E693|nr:MULTISPECIES: hypothetical protein [unclassified Rhizobium]MBB3593240.1 hypothetical protein [Rhizobium sp. BK529]TCS03039.1 hypothetical protein EV281_104119 [Rhizobium sp. BK418]
MAPVTEILIGLAVVSILIVAFAVFLSWNPSWWRSLRIPGRFVLGQGEGGLEVSFDCDDGGDGGGDGGGD